MKKEEIKEVSIDQLESALEKAKSVKILSSKLVMKEILVKSGYSFNGKEILNEHGTPIFGIDGKPATSDNPAMLAGSNIFIPKNVAALFKYYSEHKKQVVTILPIPIPTPEQLKQASDILTLIKKFFKKKDKAGSVIKAKGIPYEQLKDMNEILILEMDGSQYLEPISLDN